MKTLALFLVLVTMALGVSVTKIYGLITTDDTNHLTGTFTMAPDTRPDVYIIRNSRGWGSGNLVQTELGVGIATVRHVVSDDMEIFLYPNDQVLIPWERYTCQQPTGDSPCFIKLSVELEPSIVRIPNLANYSNLEFVVWDKDQQLWLPFTFDDSQKIGEAFAIKGQIYDPGTRPSEYAMTREGMSGSALFLAQDGVPLLNENGMLTSLGELTEGYGGSVQSVVTFVFNTKF